MVVVWSVLILLIFILAASYVCYRLCFSVPKQTEADLFRLPDTEQYAPYREAMTRWSGPCSRSHMRTYGSDPTTGCTCTGNTTPAGRAHRCRS